MDDPRKFFSKIPPPHNKACLNLAPQHNSADGKKISTTHSAENGNHRTPRLAQLAGATKFGEIEHNMCGKCGRTTTDQAVALSKPADKLKGRGLTCQAAILQEQTVCQSVLMENPRLAICV
jgi:hypothetical protein